jgi:N-acetylmuramic acid 6-phosphate etherase
MMSERRSAERRSSERRSSERRSAERRFVLGVDGGGSKTLALLADNRQQVLGRGTASSSNYQVVGAVAALSALDEAIEAACASAGLLPAELRAPALAAACIGLAGVGRPEDRAVFEAWAARRLPGIPLIVVNDAQLVLAAGTPDGWGVALICGTGSIVYAQDARGRPARAGGWGYLLGDEGSGYAIGQAGVRAVMRAFDGRSPRTMLTQMILAHWGLSTPSDLVNRVYGEALLPADIAALAPLVEAGAAGGDEVAQQILRDAGRELARAVEAVVRALDLPQPVPCGLAGSVIVNSHMVRGMFLGAVREAGLQLNPVTPVIEPARGALRLARGLI